MGKYLKLASKVIEQNTSILERHCDINDKTPLNDESSSQDREKSEKSEKSITRVDTYSRPVAAKIYSHILQDMVWLALDPTFAGNGDGIPVYTIEEIRMMKGANPEEMQAVHRIKKELGGRLITIKGGRGNEKL